MRKAEKLGISPGPIKPKTKTEKALVLTLDSFDKALATAEAKRMPHIICDHVFALAQAFSKFYAECPVLAESVPQGTKRSRLALAALTLRQLELGLELLGIETPARM